MALVPLSLPPGVWRNGTTYQAKGRYFDSNLVRWYDGQLRPWGGWSLFSSTAIVAPPVRGMLDWIDSSGLFWMLLGTPTNLYVSDNAGDITDITPSGLAAGRADATNVGGYGGSTYGTGTYGNARGASTLTLPATVWTMDTLEQNPVACNADDGKIYSWDLNTAHLAAQCSGSPSNCRAVFVTQEGFVMALGSGGDPRAVQWADQSSFTAWTPTASNQARSYEIQTAGALMCGTATRAGSLLFTTTDIHLQTFIGLPLVYSFQKVGTRCGIVSQAAFVVAEDFVAWMGNESFWQYNGAVSAIESDVGDFVFSNLNTQQRSKIWAIHNATFGEVVWFYPSIAGTEVDSYVTYNYREGHWNIGQLARTSGLEAGIQTNPIMVDPSGNIWSHEVNFTYTGAGTPYAETGPMEFGDTYLGESATAPNPGTYTFDIVQIIPDSKTLGDVEATFFSSYYPLGPETASGPYTMANPTSVRIGGRQTRARFTATSASDWRIGTPRFDVRQGGMR